MQVGGWAGFQANALLCQVVDQGRIFNGAKTMTDSFGPEVPDGRPDTPGSIRFTCVDGYMQAGIPNPLEMLFE